MGGTGGHVYPAIALAQSINVLRPDAEVFIFGAAGGAEERIAQHEGIAFRPVRAVRLPQKKLSPAMAGMPLALAGAVAGARAQLRAAGATHVIGFGGYVSFPTVIAARLAGLPVYLQEQNTAMGKSNRLMAHLAQCVFTSFEDTEGAPPGVSVYAGNPSRFEGVAAPDATQARVQLGLDPARATLFVFGGSQGAVAINEAAVAFAGQHAGRGDWQILHIAGPKNYEGLKKQYESALGGDARLKVKVEPYMHEMHLAYAAADLAVCRAGATTIAELMCQGVASVLVPYPFAAENHQEKNARYLCSHNAAELIRNSELDRFGDVVAPLLQDAARLKEMSGAARALYRPGAARLIVEKVCGTKD